MSSTPEDPLRAGDIRVDENGIPWTPCPSCGQSVIPSANGWRRHLPFCPALAAPPVEVGEDGAFIDATCSCKDCEERTTETYDLPGRCLNCGTTFTVRSRKGDKPPLHVECPACQVREFSWRAALRSAAPALDVERLARALLAWGGALHEAGVVTLDEGGLVAANAIAREYAALRSPQPPEAVDTGAREA